MPMLTAADMDFFRENGYVVVPSGIPKQLIDGVVDAIWKHLGMDPDNPEDWYRPPLDPAGFVNLVHHPALWATRQYPTLHQIFAEIYGTHKLWVSLDRVGMKPPQHPKHPDYDFKGFIHWDMDTSNLNVPFSVQGVLALRDTGEDQGGFQCVPGHHRILEEWIKTQPKNRDPRRPDLTGLTVKPIAMKEGDIVIWDRRLSHGNGHNVSGKPRLAQYITFTPAREDDAQARARRLHHYKHRIQALMNRLQGEVEPIADLETPELTPLGRRLLGVDRW